MMPASGGWTSAIEDGLLWFEPSHRLTEAIRTTVDRKSGKSLLEAAKDWDYDKIFVYRKADLDDLISRLMHCMQFFLRLEMMFQWRPSPQRDEVCQQLSSEPYIRQILSLWRD